MAKYDIRDIKINIQKLHDLVQDSSIKIKYIVMNEQTLDTILNQCNNYIFKIGRLYDCNTGLPMFMNYPIALTEALNFGEIELAK